MDRLINAIENQRRLEDIANKFVDKAKLLGDEVEIDAYPDILVLKKYVTKSKRLEIPHFITVLGPKVFSGSGIEELIIGHNVQIYQNALYGSLIKTVVFNSSDVELREQGLQSERIECIQFNYNNIKVPKSFCCGCTELVDIQFNGSIESIDTDAFSFGPRFTSLKLNNTSVNKYAFRGATIGLLEICGSSHISTNSFENTIIDKCVIHSGVNIQNEAFRNAHINELECPQSVWIKTNRLYGARHIPIINIVDD